MNPGRVSQFLLFAFVGAAEAEFVAGDLAEEFASLANRRGPRVARRWYFRQVVRSILPLLTVRLRSGEFTRALLAAAGAVIPLAILDRLWSFVYSQIPLKESLHRDPALLAMNVGLLVVSAWLAGLRVRTRPEAVSSAVLAAALTALVLCAGPAPAPVLYVALAIPAAPVGCLTACCWRRSG